MANEIDCTFEVTDWQEQVTREDPSGRKLTSAKVAYSYAGGLTGTGNADYLMTYTGEGTAVFVGREWVEGEIAGKKGGCAVEQSGTFDGGVARSRWTVIEGTGIGDWAGIRGGGEYAATDRTVSLPLKLILPSD